MEHFIRNKAVQSEEDCYDIKQKENNNIGLVCGRGTKLKQIDNIFIADFIINYGLCGPSYIFPLYIYDTPAVRKILREESEEIGGIFEDINHFKNAERIENFTPNFRKFINEKYGGRLSPEEILGYIYAVLFHKKYRKKYLDFLKIDFPKIPFVESKEDFLKFSKLGQKLYNLHLMKDKDLDANIGESFYLKERENIIKKSNYNEEEKKIYANESLYFSNVSKEIWEYKIGGCRVLNKYLKSHKGEELDINHFEKVIRILAKTIEIENEIEKMDCSPKAMTD